jgi:hypothetical protein
MAKLPPGSYKVHVNSQGRSVSRDVTVRDGGQQQVTLTWPATSDEPIQAGDSPDEGDFRYK